MDSDEGFKELITPFLTRIGRKWGHYCRYNREVIEELKKAGLLIDIRHIERDIKSRRDRKDRFVEAGIKAGRENLLWSGTKGYFPRGHRQRLMKKSPVLKIPRNTDKDIGAAMLAEIRNFQYEGDIAIVGFDWENNNEFTVTSLDDCFRADRENKRLNKAKTPLKVDVYPGNPEDGGITVVVYDVPSFSDDSTYTVHIYQVGSYMRGVDHEKMKKISLKFESEHECPKSPWIKVKDSRKPRKKDINQRPRQGKEHYQCQHVILAFKQAKFDIPGRVIDPFIERKDVRYGVPFFNGLDNLILETNTPKGPRRDLAIQFERESALWDLMEYNTVNNARK